MRDLAESRQEKGVKRGVLHYIGAEVAIKKKNRAGQPLMPERNRGRRALSHVGGAVSFQGDAALENALKTALRVRSDETATRAHIHGFHSYPARMHPDTARALIEEFSKEGEVVLDPFCGSGTAVIEARLLARTAFGRDLNPLAIALAKLKSRGSNREQREAWLDASRVVCEAADRRRIEKVPPTELYPPSDLEFFEIHVLLELDGLRAEIRQLPDAATRRVLHLALSSLITKVSRRHGDSSRKQSQRRLPSGFTIRWFFDRVEELMGQMEAYQRLLPKAAPEPNLQEDDARKLSSVPDDSVDLLLSSPPYPGVYDYHDHHAARLRWLGMKATTFEKQEMGSRRRLNALSGEEAEAVWARDFGQVLISAKRVLRAGRFAFFMIGDSAVSGKVLRSDEMTTRLAKAAGLDVVALASQRRPQFHFESQRTFGGRPRFEHLIALRRLDAKAAKLAT